MKQSGSFGFSSSDFPMPNLNLFQNVKALLLFNTRHRPKVHDSLQLLSYEVEFMVVYRRLFLTYYTSYACQSLFLTGGIIFSQDLLAVLR